MTNLYKNEKKGESMAEFLERTREAILSFTIMKPSELTIGTLSIPARFDQESVLVTWLDGEKTLHVFSKRNENDD